MIQDMISSETIWIQLNRQTQTYSRTFQLFLAILPKFEQTVSKQKIVFLSAKVRFALTL